MGEHTEFGRRRDGKCLYDANRGKKFSESEDTVFELKGEEARNYLISKGEFSWSDETVDLEPEQLDTYAFRAFKKAALSAERLTKEEVKLPVADILNKLRLLRDGKPTRAALILFAHNAEEVSFVACIRICKEINGDIEFFDEIHGPMFLAVNRALDLLTVKYAVKRISYKDGIRTEEHPYSGDVLREAIVNAVINADYTSNRTIKISVLPDRLIIQNPGSIPCGYTVEELIKEHISKPRNRGIAAVFRAAGTCESSGSGFEKMNLSYLEQNLAPPKYKSFPQDFVVTFTNVVVTKNAVSRNRTADTFSQSQLC